MKSSIMVGIGEEPSEVLETLADLRAAGVDIVTLGQYLRPTPKHAEVARYVTPGGVRALRARGEGARVCVRRFRAARAVELSRRRGLRRGSARPAERGSRPSFRRPSRATSFPAAGLVSVKNLLRHRRSGGV